MGEPVESCSIQFQREKHIKFCIRCLGTLPQICDSLDSTRLPVVFFAISGLDLLGAIPKIEKEKKEIIEWVYSFQILPNSPAQDEPNYGFRGSTTCFIDNSTNTDICDKANIASTYTALCILLILGDDFNRVDKRNIVLSVRKLQLPNGSFRPIRDDGENDMRLVYCAACICYILQDWDGMDIDKTIDYIKKSVNFDGGIAQGPGLESHAGSTYCAIAALWLMGRLETTLSPKQLKSLIRWLVFRQQKGFQGRPNKPDDTCYSFWVGATMKILNCYDFINYSEVLEFVLSTQDEIIGGLGKWVDMHPDLLHTYLGISGLFLKNEKNSSVVIFPALNISNRAVDHLCKLHNEWNL